MEEIWKHIECEPDYEVSNLGNIRSVERIKMTKRGFPRTDKSRKITPKVDRDGYLIVRLGGYEKRLVYKVHRLVASAFIPNPNNLPMVNHKDETRVNNRVDNLEWCDHRYNINYGTSQHRRVLKIAQKVDLYTLKGEYVCTYESISECARKLNAHKSSVISCVNGKTHTCYDYVIKRHGEPFSLNRKDCYVTHSKSKINARRI